MSTEIDTIGLGSGTAQLIFPKVPANDDDEDEDACAFHVLNKDNLKIPVSGINIIGQPVIKSPFASLQSQKLTKPNGIVLPQRRIMPVNNANNNNDTINNNTNNNNNSNNNRQNLEYQKQFAKSNGSINIINERNILRKNILSNSQGHLNHQNSSVKIRIEDLQNHGLDKNFTKTLDAKLRKLQKDNGNGTSNSSSAIVSKPEVKPRFVTTVKKGEFLEPPPEVASLLGLAKSPQEEAKKLYAFSSQPRILDRNVEIADSSDAGKFGHKTRREAAAKAATVATKGIGQIEEVIITKREVNSLTKAQHNKKLGDVPLPYQNLMFERRVLRGSTYALNSSNTGDGESAAARAAEARRRALARKKTQSQQLRVSQLRLSSPSPVNGRRDEKLQTEPFLEELWEHPQISTATTQTTDLLLDRPESPKLVGADAETQIWPGELFDFDMEVQPILEVLVGKTIEQALIEVLEEEELAALQQQQRKFLEVHAAELAESLRLQELERMLEMEKERRLAEYEEGLRVQQELEERVAGAVLVQGYMDDLLPSVLDGLQNEGVLGDDVKQNMDESFLPWLTKEVISELREMIGSRDLLTEIVREILENRAEIHRALNESKEESDEEGTVGQDIPLVEHLNFKEESAPNSIELEQMEQDKLLA